VSFFIRQITLVLCFTGLLASGHQGSPASSGLDEYVPAPDDNPVTAVKARLGERLFFDRTLSADGRISCASCHDPARAFSSGTPVSTGVFGRQGTRNVPTILNRAYGRYFFWDGRAQSLEEQVLGPVQNPSEMGLPLSTFTARLHASDLYLREFSDVFGEPPSVTTAARALATFIRVQRAGDAPFDRYRGGDTGALSVEAIRGLNLFRGRARCSSCHVGPNFTDEQFHNTGVSWGARDVGRYRVTRRLDDLGRFKTPTLRQLRLTGPYMHDGTMESLEGVIDFYDAGGHRNPHIDAELQPLRLTAPEKRDLMAFLLSLSS